MSQSDNRIAPERVGTITVSYRCWCDRCDRWVGAITNGETRSGIDAPVCGVMASGRCSVCGRQSDRLTCDFVVGVREY